MTKWLGVEEFVAIVETGSFTQAAKALDVSTAYISRALAHLEDRLQTRLINRTTRENTLTTSGKRLIEPLKKLVVDRDIAMSLVPVNGPPRGELRVACPDYIANEYLMPVLRQYVRKYPELFVSIYVTNSEVKLHKDRIDIAIKTGSLENSNLIAQKLGISQMVTCASSGYIKEHGHPRYIDELKNYNCIVASNDIWHFGVDGEEIVFTPSGNWCSNSYTATLESTLEGLGISQLPQKSAASYIEKGKLVEVLYEFRPPPEPIWAVYPHRLHLQSGVRNILNLLSKRLMV